MNLDALLLEELRASVQFFLDFTNQKPGSRGFGLTVDSTKKPGLASIASTGFALTAWVIAAERGWLDRQTACQLARQTLLTLSHSVAHHRGFLAHFVDIDSGERFKLCEYSTIDTALCLNGVITAAAYFREDSQISDLAQGLLARVEWDFIVFERDGKTLFRMAYNPDPRGDYVTAQPGFISQWDMAAEQKMMYLQAAPRLEPATALRLYRGFRRDIGYDRGLPIIINPGGSLFAYQFSEAWLDSARYLDPDGVDWFENTRRAALANRNFCLQNASGFKTYHANSWGLSAGDSPRGYAVFGSAPCLGKPRHDGTVSIYAAAACLPFAPEETLEMLQYLHRQQPQTWGKYGFFDAYNLDVSPAWYSQAIYAIDKGCSMIMIENHLSRLVWEVYTNSAFIQGALHILGFQPHSGEQNE